MHNVAFQIGPFVVRWYGIIMVVAIVTAIIISNKRAVNRGFEDDLIVELALFMVPFGVIGARLYYVLFNWSYYANHTNEIWQVWNGGLAIHGGIIFGALGLALGCYLRKLNFLKLADIIAPALILAQAIGRWGNYFNQEAFGYETSVPWAMEIAGAMRHPTFLYESIWDLAGFGLLLLLDKKRDLATGQLIALYFIYYSLGRVWIEWFRTDSLMLGPIKMAMLISVLGIILGAVLYWYQARKAKITISGTKKI